MSSNPLISVIMPAYNAEKYIEQSILSILKQSFTDFEFIIIDDCSHDNTFKIIKNFAYIDPRIIALKNQENLKISKTLNKALELAKGEYIARMDSDDIALADRFENQLSYLEKNSDIVLLGTAIEYIDDNGTSMGKPASVYAGEEILKAIKYRDPIAHPTWMFRADIIRKIGGYRNLPPAEDYDLLLRLVSNGYKIDNINDLGLLFRFSNNNTANINGLKQRKAVNYALNLYNERLKTGKDSFSEENFKKYTQSSKLLNYLHNKSQYFFNKAGNFRLRGQKISASIYYIISCILSPYQLQFGLRGYLSKK